jgi:hypothetical protein
MRARATLAPYLEETVFVVPVVLAGVCRYAELHTL